MNKTNPKGNFITSTYLMWLIFLPFVTIIVFQLSIDITVRLGLSGLSLLLAAVCLVPSVVFYGLWWKKIFHNYAGYFYSAALAWVFTKALPVLHILFFLRRGELPQILKIKQLHWSIDLVLSACVIGLIVPWLFELIQPSITFIINYLMRI